jgi:hypothetical protein
LTGRISPTYTTSAMENLLDQIDLFCATHGMKPTRFGALALNDKALVAQLRKGRRLWPETSDKIVRFMASYRPETERAAA